MDRQQALTQLTATGAPYELADVELYGRACRAFVHAPPTLRALFDEARCELPFLVYEEERHSYEEVWSEASRLAEWFRGAGVGPGDRVAISMRNYPEWIVGFTAATSIGAIAVAMNSLWQPDEMAYGLRDSAAKVLLADGERLERFSKCAAEFPALWHVLAVRTRDLWRAPERATRRGCPAPRWRRVPCRRQRSGPNDDATILYTSGSTGHPKGVVSCHRNVIAALMSWELDAHAGALMRGRPLAVPEEQLATLLGGPPVPRDRDPTRSISRPTASGGASCPCTSGTSNSRPS